MFLIYLVIHTNPYEHDGMILGIFHNSVRILAVTFLFNRTLSEHQYMEDLHVDLV